MNVGQLEVTIGELVDGYLDDGEGGVIGYSGKLDIRPQYQREYVYKDKQRNDVIRSVLAGFPLNVMYWAVRPDGNFEVLDGQQRTISIARYLNGDFSIDGLYYANQPEDVCQLINNYRLLIYVCDGESSEKLDWFRIVNIAGVRLTDQELRNAVYSGPWVSEAKRYFSRTGCAAKKISDDYVEGTPIKQELLETAIKWVSRGQIDDYMGIHQHDQEIEELWTHFQAVIGWIESTFPEKRPNIMRKVGDWGSLYDQHKNKELDSNALEKEIRKLLGLENDVIQKQQGIYPYVLDGDERHLNLRAFKKNQKNIVYERQKGLCPNCDGKFKFEEMEGDHIKPWKEGGITVLENLQMLCRPCNRKKSSN